MTKFHNFSAGTGLRANPTKCKVYFGGVPINVQQQILEITKFSEGNLPFKYLGVPMTSRKLAAFQYEPLIEKILGRIRHWTARLLSSAGRLQLIKSVLFAITAYWMHVFPIPKKVLHRIEAICRTFLWSGTDNINRKSPIAWDTICYSKAAGGMNTTSLVEWNVATISKLLWNIQAKEDKMWIKWMNAYYIKGQSVYNWQVKPSCSWMLKKLMQCRDKVCQTAYWTTAVQDKKYITARMYCELRGCQTDVNWKNVLYHNGARPRARFMLRMTLHGRIATKDRLVRFSIKVDDKCCCWCKENETLEHLFFACDTTVRIWRELLAWLGIYRQPAGWRSEKDWLITETKKKGWRNQILKILIAETVYEIWRRRNEIIFSNSSNDNLMEMIKTNAVGRCTMTRKLGGHVNVKTLSIV
ncbi:uncharacterized protein LOC131659667 [Vicia villosa]|uniref:uncharacterized protein LOC131659667 n=1 Tax=Vicia villosa TaxID=3911 RepID=UPI00273C52FA|nr:uncharacterized protein LOC131659667 [Vicia villosa]